MGGIKEPIVLQLGEGVGLKCCLTISANILAWTPELGIKPRESRCICCHRIYVIYSFILQDVCSVDRSVIRGLI